MITRDWREKESCSGMYPAIRISIFSNGLLKISEMVTFRPTRIPRWVSESRIWWDLHSSGSNRVKRVKFGGAYKARFLKV